MKKLIFLALAVCLVGCGKEADSTGKNIEVEKSKLKPISEYAYTKYSKDQFPKTYSNWGDEWVAKFPEFEKQAANKIASEVNSCDSIEMVALSDNKSTPKKEAVFFVDCSNGERFYVSQKELTSLNSIKSQSEKAMSQDDAFLNCQQLVKSSSKYPSSVNFKILDTSGFTAKTTGNVVINIGFDAKNDFGVDVSAKARCVFTTDGESEITITQS